MGSIKYLGRRLSFHEPHLQEVEHRIGNAWKKFYAHKKILCDRHYSLADRLKLFDAIITPSVLYGCESWTLTADLEHKLRKAQRHMLRSILRSGRRRWLQPAAGDAESQSSDSNSSGPSASCSTSSCGLVEVVEPWSD